MSENSKETIYKFPKACQMDNARTIYSDLEKLYDSNNIVLDLSEIIILTTPIIQLMISFVKSMRNQEKQIVVQNPSEECSRAACYLGISYLLKEWSTKNE